MKRKTPLQTAPTLPWQRPNCTEAYAAEKLAEDEAAAGAGYLPFAWASWIDLARDKRSPAAPHAATPPSQPLATVAQHIEMLQHSTLLRRCGITDLFWSHATTLQTHHQGMRIHPFPLYPVRCASHPGGGVPLAQRRWLYSFQGVYRPELYLTPVRQWVLALPPRPDALLQERSEWHFEQKVYRELVHGQPADAARHAALASEASAYAEALQQSVFALCPSGSGPNSIRLWEALGYGAIPVIMADTLALPGDRGLWQQAALLVPETPEAVAALPVRLQKLRSDPAQLAAMQAAGQRLWQRYGLPDFVADLRTWLSDPDAALLAAAHRRLSRRADDHEVVVHSASSASAVPLELRQRLQRLDTAQPLLLQICDLAPLPLLEARWRAPLQLCSRLLTDRPWTICSRSPLLEQLSVCPPAQTQPAVPRH